MSNRKQISRRRFLKAAAIGSSTVVLSACGASAPATPAATTAASPAASTAASTSAAAAFTAGVTPGSPLHAKGWTTQLPPAPAGMPRTPPVTITSSRNATNLKFAGGDTFENSPFTRLVRQQLGINWKVKFTYATPEERDQKYNLAQASGDLPDFMEAVPLTAFVNMVEAGLVEDITEVWERTASQRVKQNLAYSNNLPWLYAEVDGRKMGIPFVEKVAQNDKLLWLRQDWLEKVGMEAPRTLDELGRVAKAFKDQQLGAGAAGTTVGLLACQELNTWYASLDPVFGAYGTIPNYWLKADDGSLVYGATLPAMKEALALLSQWYKDGVLPSDFDTKQAWEQNALVAGNQAGLVFAPFFGGSYGPADSLKNDPSARWTFVDVPTGPHGRRGKAWSNPIGQFVHCFRKGFPHADAVIQQTNWLAEWYEAPNTSRMHGWEGYNYAWDGDAITLMEAADSWAFWPFGPVGNSASNGTDVLRGSKNDQIAEEWSSKAVAQLDAGQALTLNDPTGLIPNVRKAYIHATSVSDEQGIKNHFLGLPTATMTERGSDLGALETTTLLGMIKGTTPLSEFDSFVTTWRQQGGDQITYEVNEWRRTRQT